MASLVRAEGRVVDDDTESFGERPLVSCEESVIELRDVSKVQNLGEHPYGHCPVVLRLVMTNRVAMTPCALHARAGRREPPPMIKGRPEYGRILIGEGATASPPLERDPAHTSKAGRAERLLAKLPSRQRLPEGGEGSSLNGPSSRSRPVVRRRASRGGQPYDRMAPLRALHPVCAPSYRPRAVRPSGTVSALPEGGAPPEQRSSGIGRLPALCRSMEPMTTTSDRVEFRVTPDLKQELEEAASAVGVPVAAFVKDAAIRSARQTLREQHQLQLDAEAWNVFSAAVDRPGRVVPGFADLLSRPSLFGTA